MTTTQGANDMDTELTTIAAIKAHYAAKNPNGHWFDADAMRFWSTRFSKKVFPSTDGGAYFVSSEQDGTGSRRLYSVRRINADGNIDTMGGFQGYDTLSQALTAAKRARDIRNGANHLEHFGHKPGDGCPVVPTKGYRTAPWLLAHDFTF